MLVKLVKAASSLMSTLQIRLSQASRPLGTRTLDFTPFGVFTKSTKPSFAPLRDDDMELVRLLGVAFVFHKDTNSWLLKALLSQDHLLLQALDFLVQSFKLVRNRIVEPRVLYTQIHTCDALNPRKTPLLRAGEK